MNILQRLFRSKRKLIIQEPIYNFVEVDAINLGQYADGLKQIQQRSIDGFLIRNAFSSDEVNALIKSFDSVPENMLMRADSGLIIYPEAFSVASLMDSKSTEFNAFFERCEFWWQEVKEKYHVDFPTRIIDLVSQIAHGFELRVPNGPNGKGKFTPANFRRVIPGKGTFKPHCGNYFHNEFPQIYSMIEKFSNPKNQMSFFLCLEAPKQGGELVLYDVEWKNAHVRQKSETVLEDINGRQIDLRASNTRKQMVKPSAGDVVLFAGGEIWHEVMTIPEGDSRLTLGGFLTAGIDKKSYYFWS